jgi:hypothetical protein
MGHGIGHGISGRRLEGCCNHRANRGRGQNLKGRSWARPAPAASVARCGPGPVDQQLDVYQRTLRYLQQTITLDWD